jgi:DNA-binding MarR family transcriptional regulator
MNLGEACERRVPPIRSGGKVRRSTEHQNHKKLIRVERAEIWAGLPGPLRLSPPHSGIMWLLNESAGISQHEMASTLRMHPSRLVGLLDDLEKRRLIGGSS